MIEILDAGNTVPIKAWVDGVDLEHEALRQVVNAASLPIVGPHVAVMPDVHWGIGATVGSVIPTRGAIIPAAVGVDIGCGMAWVQTDLMASDLPDNLEGLRTAIENDVPKGFESNNWAGHEKGGWKAARYRPWPKRLDEGMAWLDEAYPILRAGESGKQLGSLGGGNHFIEVCLDENQRVSVLLHSGSRGVGNRIGQFFIARAQERLGAEGLARLPDRNLAYFTEHTPEFTDYVRAVGWAQMYARENRHAMMAQVLRAAALHLKREIHPTAEAVNCHHNYVQEEIHFGERVWLTRKGAVYAGKGALGIIPGSMGARSYIVEGLGNPESFESCSHGAGRRMSRGKAKQTITLADHVAATEGVACRKDAGVLDESPAAYKSIDAVMAAQADLVKVVHTLKQVVCIKG